MSESPKLGAGHASAMFRLGLRELRNGVNPSRDSVADTELGLYGTRTPGEVAEIRHGETWTQEYSQERPMQGPELER